MVNWLYSFDDEANKYQETELAKLLLSHGANHWCVAHVVMTSVVLEYYNHYLNGETVASIEDLVVNYWFRYGYYTLKNSTLTKQQLKRSMETGIPISIGSHKENWLMRRTIL